MKKTLLFVSLLTVGAAFGQNCTEIFISEYVEGSGNDKALELYNPTAQAINLNGYTIERHSNGASNATAGGTLALVGVIAPGETFVIVNGQTLTTSNGPASSQALRDMADLLDGTYPAPTYMNGNDAILLKKNGAQIDIMGKSGDAAMSSSQSWSDEFPFDGSQGVWWTKDHSLQRKATVMAGVNSNPVEFNVTIEWDSLPKDNWTNLGLHTCNCILGINENKASNEFYVFPNPAKDLVSINSKTNFSSISLINLLGKEVLVKNNHSKSNSLTLDVKNLDKGVYIIQLKGLNNQLTNRQLIIE